MRIYDNHSHTREFSPDGSQSFDELIADVEAAGLAGFMITEHYDKDMIDGIPHPGISEYGAPAAAGEWVFPFAAARERTEAAREALVARGSELEILHGIEIGWLPYQNPGLWDWMAGNGQGFDGIIVAVHCVDGRDIYYDRRSYEDGRAAAYGRYLDHAIDLLRADLDFDILGHFDYVMRYAHYEDARLLYEEQAGKLDEIFRLLIAQGKSLEFNTRTRYRLLDAGGVDIGLPDGAILRRYLELGGERVSLGSDCHEAGNAGRFFPDMIEWLRANGLRYLTHFRKREAVFESIE
ncbi:MAG: histidinol-phosphatase HisJ family protein [Bacillota bacterium]|nr:histidinol-phosphatase HisJ family protein [Bacillota bacterium]